MLDVGVKEHDARTQANLERIKRFRTMDDTFMRQVFKGNLPLAQRVLRIVTGVRDLELIEEETQRDVRMTGGAHSVVLDVWGVDSKGTQYDLEVQTGSSLEQRRFRYYGACMDISVLGAGKSYDALPEQWVVVVLEKDPDGESKNKRDYCMREPGHSDDLGDGRHLLYLNGAYRGDDELGSLMADFCQSDPSKIHDDLLRERVQYLKKDPEGVARMCKISEEIFNEGIERGIEQGIEQNITQSVLALTETMRMTAQEALAALKVPEAEWGKYLAAL